MRRTIEDFRAMSIRDLHDELMNMALGDGWDGMVSKGLRIEITAAEKAWEEKMNELDKSNPILPVEETTDKVDNKVKQLQ